MEYFEFEDCGPKLKQALLEMFKNEEIAALEVCQRIALRAPKDGTSQRKDDLMLESQPLIIAAVASHPERGKALLALVGDALLSRRVIKEDAILIPVVLTRWLSFMVELSKTA